MTWSSTATRGLTGPRRPLRRLGGFGSLASSIPLGFSAGRPLSPFSRAISARWAATVRSRAATLLSNSRTSAFSSVGESASRSPGGAISPGNQRQERRGSENRAVATSFAAGTDFAGTQGVGLHPGLQVLIPNRSRLELENGRFGELLGPLQVSVDHFSDLVQSVSGDRGDLGFRAARLGQ